MEVASARRGLVVVRGPDGMACADVVAGTWPPRSLEERVAAGVRMLQTGTAPGELGATCADGRPGAGEGRRPGGTWIPLWGEGRLLGLVYLSGLKRRSVLTRFDIEILDALADHAAMILTGLRLNRRIRDLMHRLRQAGAAEYRGGLDQLEPCLGMEPDATRPRGADLPPAC
jgi:hypothetical protein